MTAAATGGHLSSQKSIATGNWLAEAPLGRLQDVRGVGSLTALRMTDDPALVPGGSQLYTG
jgi:hypothetical protein